MLATIDCAEVLESNTSPIRIHGWYYLPLIIFPCFNGCHPTNNTDVSVLDVKP